MDVMCIYIYFDKRHDMWTQVEPKAQLVLVANTSSTYGDNMCPSESLELQTNISTTSENNLLHHRHETCEASDILLTPRFVDVNDESENGTQRNQNGGVAGLKAVQQAVILAQCLSIEKSTRHNEMQSKLLDFLGNVFL